MNTLIQAFLSAYTPYANSPTRSRRRDYWLFTLANTIVQFALMLLIAVAASITGDAERGLPQALPTILLLAVYIVFCLASAVPGLALTARRLHDTGRSGWWILLNFIPYLGAIVLLVFLVLDSQPGENKWGPAPKTPAHTPGMALS